MHQQLKFIVLLLIIIPFKGFAQEEEVFIVEKKQGKRIVLSAKNTTNDSINIFLLVHAEGFRRSSSAPIIKNTPPNSTTYMTTLIEIEDTPSSYRYDLYLNAEKEPLVIDSEKKINDISSIIKDRIVLFVTKDCDKCIVLENLLKNNRVTFKAFDIYQDEALYKQFKKFVQKDPTQTITFKLPLIWNKSYAVYGYDNLESILEELTN
ncbi:glutaredoxin domain-containing protein [Patiriisocius hiemis]|uniref:Glutaredoxin domain-containing protein n=1 Tax=Patiriisocius hiemis TaxID=3075604 RepID=A0ABU2YA88_9FLAO|nr:glutaredoxin domain-containing protein [Constantimarinum sp. W242]MDT0555109.1 hypothetical protein [Constantimarinum sp. W242]